MEKNKSHAYTKEDLRYVQENYPTKTVKEMAQHLNRTKYSLKFQIEKWCNRGELERKKQKTVNKAVSQRFSEFFTWDDYRCGVIAPKDIGISKLNHL